MSELPMHARRDRAESFGAVAAAYDRYRPGYPDEFVDELAALRPSSVLDVGCGTGKAARLLSARGLPVLGVEIDPEMAAVARSHGLSVEVASFEEWDDHGRTFDLITCAQAWHWVDPAVGAPKLARLLRPGGTACLFWNFGDLDEPARSAEREVYRRLAPHLTDDKPGVGRELQARTLRESGCFTGVAEREYPWQRVIGIDDWLGRTGTHSAHVLLGERLLGEVLAELRAALTPFGPELLIVGGTYSVWANN